MRKFAGLDLGDNCLPRYINDTDIVILRVRHVNQLAQCLNDDMRRVTTYFYIRRAREGKRYWRRLSKAGLVRACGI